MSFPNYSSLFTLGVSSSSAVQPTPAPKQKPTTIRRRSRSQSLKSLLKLDTRTESTPAVPALPIITPYTPVSPTHMSTGSPPVQLMHRRSRDSLRSIPSPKPVPSSQLPELPGLGVPSLSSLSPSTSPASVVFTLPRTTSSPATSKRVIMEATANSPNNIVPVRPPVHTRQSSTTLGLGLNLAAAPP